MKIKRSLRPGQAGTKNLLEKYGANLVCVRYRYDDKSKKMFKTIEIIVASKPWQPNSTKIPKNKIMNLRIATNEVELRNLVKAAGGKWNHKRQVWQLCYEKVIELGMTDRIVNDEVKDV